MPVFAWPVVAWTILAYFAPSFWSRGMRFWGSLSIFGVYFMNWIGALWVDFYLGLILTVVALIFGLNPWDVFTAAYEGIPSLKRAFYWKLMGLIFNVVIARVYYGGFKRYIGYKDMLNLATMDDSASAAKERIDDSEQEGGSNIVDEIPFLV